MISKTEAKIPGHGQGNQKAGGARRLSLGARGWHSWQEGSEHFRKKRLLAPATCGQLGGHRCEAWNPQLVALRVVSGGGLSIGSYIWQLEWVPTGPGTSLCLRRRAPEGI